MKKTFFKIVVLCGILGIGLAGIAMANSAVDGEGPCMMVSPSTIVLANDNVDTVTVHTNISASTVKEGSLTLDDAAHVGVWVDDCGHIVARFWIADLGLDEPGAVTLTLSGDLTDDPFSFSATDEIMVVDPEKGPK